MAKNIQYYCVGFIWKGYNPDSQIDRFIKGGIWEDESAGRYIGRINLVPVGSRVAAKTTYTKKEGLNIISILKIHTTGTVVKNPKDGKTLFVKWDKSVKPYEIKNRGGYRSTITRIRNLEAVKEIFQQDKFTSKGFEVPFYSGDEFRKGLKLYPCFVFSRDAWNDFGIYSQFTIAYHLSSSEVETIGQVKFISSEMDQVELPEFFTNLPDSICSLGQSNQFYENLREIQDSKISDFYIESTNDLAINRGLVQSFEHLTVFKNSLLRSSEAQKALREGKRIYHGEKIENELSFIFETHLGQATKKHSIKFDFVETMALPFRIKILIGKNGTGKTQYLAKLAATISGYEDEGEFNTKYLPAFSRIIAVSYSLFDRFPRPKQNRAISYYYCGFQGGRGLLTDNQIQERLKRAFAEIERNNRLRFLGMYLTTVLSEEISLDILDEDYAEFNVNEFRLFSENGESMYSSGQMIMILTLSEVLAYITVESLIIFDEPETHLHPNSVSLFIRVLYRILNRFNSYAIISTHSPQFIQEVPAKDITILERIGNTPSTRQIDIETFGENLNTLTERVFSTAGHDEFYRSFLTDISKSMSFDAILKLFEDNSLPLSFNARIYLQSLFTK